VISTRRGLDYLLPPPDLARSPNVQGPQARLPELPSKRYLPVGPRIQKLNGLQFHALLTEGAPSCSFDFVRA
jgi:hypothetical protein